ncbi:unnamed protein product [Pleuronectes platessa]|uniref:Uncharacterized protein n=1 Tax=Pleuronectes platessa TaxID=8262 RepID=A0A9N7U9T4_PLEPL|nr:unnamed protein product [Pleuronectes platessa]
MRLPEENINFRKGKWKEGGVGRPRIKPDASFVCGKYHFIREGCVEPRGPAMRRWERAALSGGAAFCTPALSLCRPPASLCGGPVISSRLIERWSAIEALGQLCITSALSVVFGQASPGD